MADRREDLDELDGVLAKLLLQPLLEASGHPLPTLMQVADTAGHPPSVDAYGRHRKPRHHP